VVNNRLNLRFFYDRRQTIPVISTAYPITNTRGGLTLRFMLAQ
jgi:cell surface protein SprA